MDNKKIALITGVSREMGLGYETALQLRDAGVTVIITARDKNKVTELARKLDVYSFPLDVSDDHSVDEAAKQIEKDFGRLHILINNAGASFDQGRKAITTEIQFVKDAFDTTLLGAWRMVKAFLPLIKKAENGRIVNVSSGAGSFTDPVFGLENHPAHVPVYAITKLSLNGLTVKLAKELQDTKIKINAVCPGFVATYPGTELWGARPVTEGAKGIVWAATLPDDAPTGKFFRDGKILNW